MPEETSNLFRNSERFTSFLNRSEAFASAASEAFAQQRVPSEVKKDVLTFCLLKIAIEHGTSIRKLLAGALYSSAFALIRCQFEALTRASWIQIAASDDWVAGFFDQDIDPDHSSFGFHKKVSKHVEEIGVRARVQWHKDLHHVLEVQYIELEVLFHDFTHGGGEIMYLALKGFRDEILVDALAASNHLVSISLIVAAASPPNRELVARLNANQTAHADVFPRNARATWLHM